MLGAKVMPVGLAGHGMLLSPVCPCRFMVQDDGDLWIMAGPIARLVVTPGDRPAAGDLVRVADDGDTG